MTDKEPAPNFVYDTSSEKYVCQVFEPSSGIAIAG